MDPIKNVREELKAKLATKLENQATPIEISDAMVESMVDIAEEATKKVHAEYAELKNVNDEAVLRARGIFTLTNEEHKAVQETAKKGFTEEVIWPETIFEKVFEGLEKDRPLLKLVNFRPSTAREKIIKGRRKGVAVFGPLHKDLEGQLEAEFDASEYHQLALTAFFLISNDTLDLGPRWIVRYIQICLREAVLDLWEDKIINGTGKDEPIGMLKDLCGAVKDGKYSDKKCEKTITFAESTILKEMTEVMSCLSKARKFIGDKDLKDNKDKEDENAHYEYRNIAGKVHMIVNPDDYYAILNAVGSRNLNGEWVYKMPHISTDKIIPTEKLEKGKIIFAVEGGYDATQSRPSKMYTYKETFAMRRATLIAVDMLGNGRPEDNTMCSVYKLKLPELEA